MQRIGYKSGCPVLRAVLVSMISMLSCAQLFAVGDDMAFTITAVINSASCASGNDGSIDVSIIGGQAPFDYMWSTGATTQDIGGLQAGTYTITVTDATGCVEIDDFQVFGAGSLALSAVVSEISCPGAMDGSIDITMQGGIFPYFFQWNNGAATEDLVGLGPGIYQLTVEDGQGCVLMDEFEIPNIPPIESTIIVNDVTCNGAMDGSLLLTPSGGRPPLTVTWEDGSTEMARSGLPAGNYSATITDAVGCTAITGPITVAEPDLLEVTIISLVNPTQAGQLGAAEIAVTGGTQPYVISWSNGEFGFAATQLDTGVTTILVEDTNGCQTETSVEIEVEVIAAQFSISPNACFEDCNGEIALNIDGGLPPYFVNWSNGEDSEVISDLCNGSYSVTVSDRIGQQVILENLEVISPPQLTLDANVSDPTCIENTDGEIQLLINGGVEPYDISWDDGDTTEERDNLTPGDYTVRVIDVNGCTISASFTINTIPSINPQVTLQNIDCNNELGSLTISGANAPDYTFLVNAEPIAGNQLDDLPPGTYLVAYTVNDGCVVNIETANVVVTSDFDLAIAPARIEIPLGETVQFSLDIDGVISG